MLVSISHSVPVTFESSEPLTESQTASLSTLVQKFSRKGETLQELDTKISEAIENLE